MTEAALCKRPTGVTVAIIINGISWALAAIVYVGLLVTMVPPTTSEQCSNIVAAANLIWMVFHFWGLGRLWRNHDDPFALKLAFLTHTISLFYSIQSPLRTWLRYLFLQPGTTEATLTISMLDLVVSLLMAAPTSAYLVRYCWGQLSR